MNVLDLEQTPLEFFQKLYPSDPLIEQRKYLGRFGVSGKMQVRKMSELSDGQKSRVVLAKLGRDVPHILLLDEPTNHLDAESVLWLERYLADFKGTVVTQRLFPNVSELQVASTASSRCRTASTPSS